MRATKEEDREFGIGGIHTFGVHVWREEAPIEQLFLRWVKGM